MTTRRTLISGAASAALLPALASARPAPRRAPSGDYQGFLDGVRAQASRAGISDRILAAALDLSQPNAKVLELDHHQPEFTMTWAQYRARIISQQKMNAGRQAYSAHLDLLTSVWQRYRVDPRIVAGIWGLESNYGSRIGTFQITDALATLAYEGRRASFFRNELIAALKILQAGDIAPAAMIGSYAGAMGQPQFMPSSYLRYAVDFDGDGRRDIWHNLPDVFGSVANYLAESGWTPGEPWGQEVRLAGPAPAQTGRDVVRTLGAWEELGVRRTDGQRFSRQDVRGALLMPDGAGGDAFLVYHNFNTIRRYNASDYYALGVGLLGNSFA